MKVYKSCWSSGSDSQLPIRQSASADGPSLIVSGFKHNGIFYNPPSTYWSQLGFWQRLRAVREMDFRCPRDVRGAGFISVCVYVRVCELVSVCVEPGASELVFQRHPVEVCDPGLWW